MRQAVGVAVFFGMLGVTLFGLIFTPIFYMVVRNLADRRARKHRLRPDSRATIASRSLHTIGGPEIDGQPPGYKISCREQELGESQR